MITNDERNFFWRLGLPYRYSYRYTLDATGTKLIDFVPDGRGVSGFLAHFPNPMTHEEMQKVIAETR